MMKENTVILYRQFAEGIYTTYRFGETVHYSLDLVFNRVLKRFNPTPVKPKFVCVCDDKAPRRLDTVEFSTRYGRFVRV